RYGSAGNWRRYGSARDWRRCIGNRGRSQSAGPAHAAVARQVGTDEERREEGQAEAGRAAGCFTRNKWHVRTERRRAFAPEPSNAFGPATRSQTSFDVTNGSLGTTKVAES